MNNYRFRCAECGRYSPWLPKSKAEADHIAHMWEAHNAFCDAMIDYRENDPTTPPSGGCLLALAGFLNLATRAWKLL
ncbi:hypothetical protein ACFXPX_27105 [Kitasatospora sp. NPDC059146]|uniref:hypothetical protein n=1 Tax=unclassified Kitasatospora TaxID=2633591 RepID=UPI0036A396FB